MGETYLERPPMKVRLGTAVVRSVPVGRYRLMNWFAKSGSPPFWSKMPGDLGGFEFVCNIRDGIAREVCYTGRYEPQETLLVKRLLAPGMTFVDVGANWGYFSLLAAHRVTRTGRVVSIDADPRIFALLEANIAANGLAQIQAIHVAAADKAGELELIGFEDESENWGLSRLSGNGDGSDARRYAVRACRLDDLFDELELTTIDVLKMDIEGAEALALKGLERSLVEKRVRSILLELHPTLIPAFGSTVDEIAALLAGHGYTPWVVDQSPDAYRRALKADESEIGAFVRRHDTPRIDGPWPHVLWTLSKDLDLRGN